MLEVGAAQGHLDDRMSVCNYTSEVMIIDRDGFGGGGGSDSHESTSDFLSLFNLTLTDLGQDFELVLGLRLAHFSRAKITYMTNMIGPIIHLPIFST